MTPIELLKRFIADHLDGMPEKLAVYELRNLEGNELYGNPNGRRFDSDDTELMRAVYQVVFAEAWNNIGDNLQNYRLRGDTLNTFATMFGKVRGDYRPEVHPGLDKHNPSPEMVELVENFYHVCWTMGNMMVLPNRLLGNDSINTYRGCHNEWHDYEDRFLEALRKVLLKEPNVDERLKDLVELNYEFFNPFYGEQGWRSFIERNFLKDYVNEDYVPVVSSKGYCYWLTWHMTDEQYFAEARRHITFSTEVIRRRSDRMISIIKDALESHEQRI